MNTSDFISSLSSVNIQPECLTPLESSSKTSLSYIAKIDGKQYFIKRLRPELIKEQLFRTIFQKEYDKGASICHPNIVKYEQICNNDDDCYILMENICGETLDKFIMTHPDYFNRRRNLDKFFNQLLSGLKCLHDNHIIHSDLKPQNIMITQINNDVKIIDLGFCFTDSYPTTAGMTRPYAAPEQTNGEKLNGATDIYAVGKIIEYIGKNTDHNLPNIYAKIMIRCLKEHKNQRFQDTEDIVKLINHRKHTIRRSIIAVISCVALFIAFRSIIYTEKFNSWWDSFEILPTHVDYNIENNHVYYRIFDKEQKRCEVAGFSSTPNAYIQNEIKINGEEYKVTHIADEAFRGKEYLKSVYIPEGIESIGKYAFIGCTGLSTISIPNSVTHIGE